MLISYLLPRHILLARLIYRLLAGVAAAHCAELTKRCMCRHIRELATRAVFLLMMTSYLLVWLISVIAA